MCAGVRRGQSPPGALSVGAARKAESPELGARPPRSGGLVPTTTHTHPLLLS